MSRNYFRSDNDDYETIISDLGIEKHIFPDGTEHYEDPGWGYVYTKEDEYSVTCPNCRDEELRYHNGRGCCPNCDSTFTDDEIDSFVGEEWFHT